MISSRFLLCLYLFTIRNNKLWCAVINISSAYHLVQALSYEIFSVHQVWVCDCCWCSVTSWLFVDSRGTLTAVEMTAEMMDCGRGEWDLASSFFLKVDRYWSWGWGRGRILVNTEAHYNEIELIYWKWKIIHMNKLFHFGRARQGSKMF